MRIATRVIVPAFLLFVATTAAAFPQSKHPAMTDPSKATERAPDTFRAKFETTKGDVVFECSRAWAPNGVDRFYNLVKIGFFDDVALFRVAKGFVVQWGIHGDPAVSAAWQSANLAPDPVVESNKRGTLTYAMAGRPDTRSTQLFINYNDNTSLDQQGFAPLCKVVEGMETADAFNGEYGERVTGMQGQIHAKGNAYLREAWPNLDYIKTAVIVGGGPGPSAKGDASADAQAGGSNLATYVILGALAAVGLFFVMRRKDAPEPKKSDAPKKKKKSTTDDKRDAEKPAKAKKEDTEAEKPATPAKDSEDED
jgi:peptidyl-prolyl cis-trans isomerase A (cyclophilin A)